MRPYGAAVITQWIEDTFLARYRSPAPAGKHIRSHKPLRDGTRAFLRDHPREQQVSRIGRDDLCLPLTGIEGHGVVAPSWHPERLFKALGHVSGFLLQAIRSMDVSERAQER